MVTDRNEPGVKKENICAIILSAGYSSRMKEFKPLLKIGEHPAIVKIARAFKVAGVERVIVVSGFKRELLSPILADNKIEEAYNKDFDKGMFGSVLTGIRAGLCGESANCQRPWAFLLIPVDSPLVPPQIIKDIIEEHKKDPGRFIVPCYMGKKGHPLLIPGKYTDEILNYSEDRGLKGVTSRYENEMIRIETGCEAVVMDMDTPENYAEIVKYHEKYGDSCYQVNSGIEKNLLKNRRIIFVRHGEIRQHKEKIFLGQSDIPLSEKGRKQAERAGDILAYRGIKVDKIYASDLSRAYETACIIAPKVNCTGISKEEGLREMALGSWDGRFIREIKEEYPEMYERRGKNILKFKVDNDSENFYDLRYRVLKTLKRILENDQSRDILIVAHSGVIKSALGLVHEKSIEEQLKEPIANGEVRMVIYDKEGKIIKRHLSGCMICGNELYNTPDKPLKANCSFCGKEEITHTFCMEGHYVCDDCHRESILNDVLEKTMESQLKDPEAMAVEIFNLPGLAMHGPEYHSIVPAVLVAACGNIKGNKNIEDIKDAIERGKSVKGGACGTHGSCGACMGVGIAYSIINKVTPYSTAERGKANLMTARALTAISETGGPRCCKRDCISSIRVAKEYFECFSGLEKKAEDDFICSQFPQNNMCILEKCPYYPTGQ